MFSLFFLGHSFQNLAQAERIVADSRFRCAKKSKVLQFIAVMKAGQLLLLIALLLSGSGKYQAGDCIQHTSIGYMISRITHVGFYEYTLRGWVDGKWGVSVTDAISRFGDDRYVKIDCPFSDRNITE